MTHKVYPYLSPLAMGGLSTAPFKGTSIHNKRCWYICNLPGVGLENSNSQIGIVDDKLGLIYGEWSNILANYIG